MELYKRAFIHRSYLKYPSMKNEELRITITECPSNCIPLKTKSNERLEFVGDGVLELITKYYLYRRFPKAREGFMTDKKIAIVKNEAIGRICQEMGLHKWLILSKNAEEKMVRNDFKRLGCLFEAFLGALFLDMNKIRLLPDGETWQPHIETKTNHSHTQTHFITGPGFQMAQCFIESIFERHIDWTELIMRDDNYKNIFQEKLQKEFKLTPHYLEIPLSSLVKIGHLIQKTNIDLTDATKYTMGVFLCLGQSIYNKKVEESMHISIVGKDIMDLVHYTETNTTVFICFGIGQNKLKKKAEQQACKEALCNLGFITS
jgi:dsRNA-specific ribonuclease